MLLLQKKYIFIYFYEIKKYINNTFNFCMILKIIFRHVYVYVHIYSVNNFINILSPNTENV